MTAAQALSGADLTEWVVQYLLVYGAVVGGLLLLVLVLLHHLRRDR